MTVRHITESDALTIAERGDWREWHGIDHNDDPDYRDGEEQTDDDEGGDE